MVVWIIGLSGAGKTTLATEIISKVRRTRSNVVLIDGDMIRDIFSNDLGHTLEDRRRNADRISRLCKLLDDQGIHVICAILSLFPESRLWNRENIKDYFEVFIDAPLESLIKRDVKGIYAKFQRGEIRNVAGMDIKFIKPECSDLVIKNQESVDVLMNYADQIANKIIESNL